MKERRREAGSLSKQGSSGGLSKQGSSGGLSKQGSSGGLSKQGSLDVVFRGEERTSSRYEGENPFILGFEMKMPFTFLRNWQLRENL